MTTNFSQDNLKQVSDFWGRESRHNSALDIYSFLPIRRYFQKLVTGAETQNPNDDWLESWFKNKYLGKNAPVGLCLSLCCGHGSRDRRLNQLGVFKNCIGMDVSTAAIASAKRLRNLSGINNIHYQTADLNSCSLGVELYDLIYIAGGAHHIANLEHLFNQVYASLKKGGLLFCDEYIGPNYSDLSFRHREIINSVIHLIPDRLKNFSEKNFVPPKLKYKKFKLLLFIIYNFRNLDISSVFERYNINTNKITNVIISINKIILKYFSNKKEFNYSKVFDISPENIKKGDPSEGIRSSEIISVLKSVFTDVTVYPYNGSIVAYALDDKFISNYDSGNPDDLNLLNLILSLEGHYCEIGDIPSIHAAIIAKK
ncbi:class I SAM-dependent methyltransferase [Polynucleobacter sp. 73C-SIWE]|uniref:class I SAM-dependent methyltransferase n=1 Tax=Polynucleobacter sp. 73C-SIWE TaxID=2689098 RepID=UPI001C0C9EDA|nr:class I SAM-dependent methyltransferase [Polynucleobacter sp. 73C-SIWE]MBU3578635.1 class I SAM-dependent methyltransferase [Polynucleobacter sp. 73C-SIWE]